jgi:TrkA-N domain
MKTIWIIGAGTFGLRAAETLGRRASIVIIEKQAGICRKLEELPYQIVCADGIDYLVKNLTSPDHPDWIVPAIPVHVAYAWVRAKLAGTHSLESVPAPDSLVGQLPNPIRGRQGELYVSNADFLCPKNCAEPAERCTVTGKPGPRILFEYLSSLKTNDLEPVVLQSKQLAAGVGGYRPRALFDVLQAIKHSSRPVLLATSCRCHGVIHIFKTK